MPIDRRPWAGSLSVSCRPASLLLSSSPTLHRMSTSSSVSLPLTHRDRAAPNLRRHPFETASTPFRSTICSFDLLVLNQLPNVTSRDRQPRDAERLRFGIATLNEHHKPPSLSPASSIRTLQPSSKLQPPILQTHDFDPYDRGRDTRSMSNTHQQHQLATTADIGYVTWRHTTEYPSWMEPSSLQSTSYLSARRFATTADIGYVTWRLTTNVRPERNQPQCNQQAFPQHIGSQHQPLSA